MITTTAIVKHLARFTGRAVIRETLGVVEIRVPEPLVLFIQREMDRVRPMGMEIRVSSLGWELPYTERIIVLMAPPPHHIGCRCLPSASPRRTKK